MKVEVAVLGSPSLRVLMVSADLTFIHDTVYTKRSITIPSVTNWHPKHLTPSLL